MNRFHGTFLLSVTCIVAVQGFGWQKTTATVGAAIIAALNTNTDYLDAYYEGEIPALIRKNEDENINPTLMFATPLAIASLGGAFLLSRPDDSKAAMRRIAFNEERQDRTYIFEAMEEGLTDEAHRKKYHEEIPEYLLSGLLAGMYYLPEERILKDSTDFGRKYTYRSYRKLEPIWKTFPTPPSTNDQSSPVTFEYQAFADIPRLTYTKDNIFVSSFRIFKFKIPTSMATTMNRELTTSIIADAERCLGIAVSNAGGYHSTKDYLRNTGREQDQEQELSITSSSNASPSSGPSPGNSNVAALAAYADEAARLAELVDHTQSLSQTNDMSTTDTTSSSLSNRNSDSNSDTHHRLRALIPSSESDEGWVNINEDGHWNRLHTHVGALWSGVYYIQSNPHTLLREYSGALLLKPTSHVSEAVPLNDLALARMSCRPATPMTRNGLDGSICDYIAIKPEPGNGYCTPGTIITIYDECNLRFLIHENCHHDIYICPNFLTPPKPTI